MPAIGQTRSHERRPSTEHGLVVLTFSSLIQLDQADSLLFDCLMGLMRA